MLFVAYLLCFAVARTLATTPLAVRSNQPACPGESVTLQCTLGGRILTWNTPQATLNLIRGIHEEGSAGSFHWTLQELNENTLQSTLTFTATTEFAIGCINASESSSVSVQIEGPPSAPDRPLTALDRIERINDTFSSVSVVWDIPETNNNYISRYVVSVDLPIFMPANGVIEAANPQFQTRKITLVLMHEQSYSIRVRADNCNNTQLGINSSALTINIQVPPAISSCVSLPVYDYFSNHLTSIEIQWEPLSDLSEQITADITADVQSYNVSIIPIGVTAPSINIKIDNDLSSCRDVCTYVFQNITEMTALYYSVFVTAKNILIDGYGERKICNNQTIRPTNDLLDVEIEFKDTDVEISCRPFTRFEGEPLCEIIYSMDPYSYSYTSESSVLLSLEPKQTFYFDIHTVGGRLDVKVLGTFETVTQCRISDLGSLLEGSRIECRMSERAVLIPDGVVCYSGTSTGSLAYTVCDRGYQLNSSPEGFANPRMCQQNGNWSGPPHTCAISPVDADFVVQIDMNTSQCQTRETETNISHGVVCYTGTTPGSMAYTLCDEGYHLVEGSAEKTTECLENGQWSRTQPQCYNTSTATGADSETEDTQNIAETCSTGLAVLGAVTFLVSFPAGAVVGAIAMRCGSKQKQTEANTSNAVYDYISHKPPEMEISTENNQCYIMKAAPKLPKPRVSHNTIP